MAPATSPDTYDAFISYHSGDSAWVDALVKELKLKGVSVWLDRDQIRPGDQFVQVLERALANVRSVVLIVSPGAMRSGWVREEFARALTLVNTLGGDRRLIPVLIDDAEPTGFLANRSWVDFRDPTKRQSNLDQLVFGITGAKDAGLGAVAVAGHLRRDTETTTVAGGVDEVVFLTRQIERTRVSAGRFRITRLLGVVPGLGISVGFWIFAQPPAPILAGVFVGAPLVTMLVAWGMTARQLALYDRKVEKYEVLRDGLEMCRLKTAPGCTTLRERFWELVSQQTRDLGAP